MLNKVQCTIESNKIRRWARQIDEKRDRHRTKGRSPKTTPEKGVLKEGTRPKGKVKKSKLNRVVCFAT